MKHGIHFLTAVLTTIGMLAGVPASASGDETSRARVVGTCSIEAELELTSIHVIWGGSGGEGDGVIECSYTDGKKERLPIWVDVWGVGVGAGVSKTVISIRAQEVRITGRASSELLGRYAMARAGGNGGSEGGSGVINFNATRDSFVIPFLIEVEEGIGFELAANIGGIRLQRR